MCCVTHVQVIDHEKEDPGEMLYHRMHRGARHATVACKMHDPGTLWQLTLCCYFFAAMMKHAAKMTWIWVNSTLHSHNASFQMLQPNN